MRKNKRRTPSGGKSSKKSRTPGLIKVFSTGRMKKISPDQSKDSGEKKKNRRQHSNQKRFTSHSKSARLRSRVGNFSIPRVHRGLRVRGFRLALITRYRRAWALLSPPPRTLEFGKFFSWFLPRIDGFFFFFFSGLSYFFPQSVTRNFLA